MGESTDKIEATADLDSAAALSTDHSAGAGHQGDDAQDVAEMRRHIEATRDDLSQTIDALQERLNPATLKQQVTDATIGKAEELAHTATAKISEKTTPIARLVKRYPLPFVVAGLIVAWLVSRLLAKRGSGLWG